MRALVWLAIICACGDDGGSAAVDASLVDAPDARQPRNQGVFAIIESKAMNLTFELATFGTDIQIIAASRDDGPCHIQDAFVGSSPRVNAGTLTVSGGTAATVTMPYVPEGYVHMASGLSYAPNDQLTLAASGATVPAFSSTISFPATVTVTSGSPTVLRKSGFTATWDATTGPVTIHVNQSRTGANLNISCTFDGPAGTGTVPASALAEVMTNDSVQITVAMETKATLMAGDYAVDLLATYVALAANNLSVQL
jgi:hypothetical protein